MHAFLQVVPLGRLGRAACKLAHVRMVVSAHHLGVCVLADGQGLIAHKLRVSSSSLTASHKLQLEFCGHNNHACTHCQQSLLSSG